MHSHIFNNLKGVKRSLILILITIPFVIIGILLSLNQEGRAMETIITKYHEPTVNEFVCGKVTGKEEYRDNALLTLNDSLHIWLSSKMDTAFHLVDFVQIDDSIIKLRNNDTIYIYRMKFRYKFW
jgi:hypothetical protein